MINKNSMEKNASHIRILLVGGGTGGHFFPLISIAEALNALPLKPELYYAGPTPYDEAMLTKEHITFVQIPSGKQRRYFSLLNYLDVFKTFFGVFVALFKLYAIYPDVIMSKGGYTSVPIVIAGAILRIPIIVHESDAVMGIANKIGARVAHTVVTAYDETIDSIPKKAHAVKLGIPIRKVLLANPSSQAITNLNVDPNRPILLVLGGSQGAERINTLTLESLDELLVDFTVIHQTGSEHIQICTLSADTLVPDASVRKHYHPIAFLNETMLNDAYHLASMIISRAGSSSIYEIALHGKPSILIPIPENVSHDQRTNAYAYARTGAGSVIEEKNLTDSLLRAEIDRIMQSEEIYAKMATSARNFGVRDTAERVAGLIMTTAHEH